MERWSINVIAVGILVVASPVDPAHLPAGLWLYGTSIPSILIRKQYPPTVGEYIRLRVSLLLSPSSRARSSSAMHANTVNESKGLQVYGASSLHASPQF